MKRWVKNSIITVCCLAPIAFVIGFSTSWSNKQHIFCVGSSGVKPFVEKMGNNYNNVNSNVDVTVEAGGSGFGITQVADGFTNIGDGSKDPYNEVNDTIYQQKWEDKKIKTVTIAWEAICIVYIPPAGIDLNNSLFELKITNDNIVDFYASFTGFYGNNFDKNDKFNNGLPKIVNNQPSMGLFVEPKNGVNVNSPEAIEEFAKWCKTPLTPYARSGGATTSGTAGAFFENSHFSNAKDITSPSSNKLNEEQISALETGKYGNNFMVQETDEANSRAWDKFSKDNKHGSITYLSSGFVESNNDLIMKNGYGIAKYDNEEYEIENISNGYNWFRPINVMLSTDSDDYIKDFVEWIIVNENSNEESAIEKEQYALGGKALTWDQISSMSDWSQNKPQNSNEWDEFWKVFWLSDYELEAINSRSSFGASE